MQKLVLDKHPISLNQFHNASVQERAFFMRSLNALTDLQIFYRCICYSAQAIHDQRSLQTTAQSIQALTFVRATAGVMHESYRLIDVGFRGHCREKWWEEAIKPEVLRDLGQEAAYVSLRKALEKIDEYFLVPQNNITWIRNKFGFHYDFIEMMKNVTHASPDQDDAIFLANDRGNSLYWVADKLLVLLLTKTLGLKPDQLEQAIKVIQKEMDLMFNLLHAFFNQFVAEFSKKYFDQSFFRVTQISLQNIDNMRDVKLPYFVFCGDRSDN